jgi:predicted acetyltransferase
VSEPTTAVSLRSPTLDDESQVAQAQVELAADDFEFVFQRPGQSWESYLADVETQRLGINIPPGRVAATFLLAEVGSDIVGRVSIRHELDEYLASVGGHIGYAVRPAYRRRGYAGMILRQSLLIAGSLGLRRVLLTCDDSNLASMRTIESSGGIFENLVARAGHAPRRRYWIEVDRVAPPPTGPSTSGRRRAS